MQVARDRPGQQPLLEGPLGHVEREAAGPVADVQVHASGHGGEHRGPDAALVVEDAPFAAVEAVGDDVPRAQDGQEVLERRVRLADVGHQRQLHGVRGLPGQVERLQVVLAGDDPREADLDPEDHVAMPLDRPHGERGVGVRRARES